MGKRLLMGRVYTRKFDWDEARRLRADGWSYARIGKALRVSESGVAFAVDDDKRTRMHARSKAFQQGTGTCDDCGQPCSRYVARCVPCATLARTTSVREHELRCFRCHEWKPDVSFTQTAKRRGKGRRGRSQRCRACHTIARQEYRERIKVPCSTCGAPCLPPSETRTGRSDPQCLNCYRNRGAR